MSATTGQSLTAAHAEVKAEISRTDSKTSLLLAFVGAVLAGAWSVGTGVHLTGPARLVGGAGLGLLLVAPAPPRVARLSLSCCRCKFG